MSRLAKIYTRKGDEGTTMLGNGKRVAKDALRVAAYGTVDELNALIGVSLSCGLCDDLTKRLHIIQNELLIIGADLAIPGEEQATSSVLRIQERYVKMLEEVIDELILAIHPLQGFILPSGSIGAATLHVARTVCRRAEREVVSLNRIEPVGPFVLPYLNRLSDALFIMALYENLQCGIPERLWDPHIRGK